MTAMIFENKIRTNNRPAFYSEKSFEFYDRSSWPAAENVRQLLNTRLLDFPVDHLIFQFTFPHGFPQAHQLQSVFAQIGRPSCRERGFKHVKITVVSATIK